MSYRTNTSLKPIKSPFLYIKLLVTLAHHQSDHSNLLAKGGIEPLSFETVQVFKLFIRDYLIQSCKSADIFQVFTWLVPYNTVNKGTSKHQKTNEKSTNFAVHISPSIFGFFKADYNQHPFKNVVGKKVYVHCCMINVHLSFVIFLILFQPPKNVYLLVELSYFILILVYPQKLLVVIYYIIIYMVNKHHWV